MALSLGRALDVREAASPLVSAIALLFRRPLCRRHKGSKFDPEMFGRCQGPSTSVVVKYAREKKKASLSLQIDPPCSKRLLIPGTEFSYQFIKKEKGKKESLWGVVIGYRPPGLDPLNLRLCGERTSYIMRAFQPKVVILSAHRFPISLYPYPKGENTNTRLDMVSSTPPIVFRSANSFNHPRSLFTCTGVRRD